MSISTSDMGACSKGAYSIGGLIEIRYILDVVFFETIYYFSWYNPFEICKYKKSQYTNSINKTIDFNTYVFNL